MTDTTRRAYSLLTVKAADDETRTITGIASTPTPDRMGDIVEPSGAKFTLPLPLLWQHDSDKPIGHVTRAKVTADGIEIVAAIAKGVSEEVDRAWSYIKSGLVRYLSIGFRGLDTEQIPNSWGLIFRKWEWLELSAVTIPANAEATITSIKQFSDSLRAATGQEKPSAPTRRSGHTQPISLRPKDARKMSKTIQEQIAALEAKRAATAARMSEIMQKAADEGRTTDASEQEEFDGLESELAPIDADLRRFKTLESAQVATVKNVTGVATIKDGDEARTPSSYRAPVQVKTNHPKGTGFIRLMAARWMAQMEGLNPADIAKERFGDTPEVEMALRSGFNAVNWVQKTAVAAGTTTSSSWAAPLVVVQNLANEFLDVLRPATILGRIPGLRRVPFNISVPVALTDPTGYWVGEGQAKPLSSRTFETVTLTQHKLAAIVAITEELAKFSSPSAEETTRTALIAALTYRMDRDLLDPSISAVTTVKPASLTNGVSPIAASGTTADAFRSDFGDLLATYLTNNMSLSGLVVVMTSAQALRLSLMRNTLGQKEFPDINAMGGTIEGIPVITSENIVSTTGSPVEGYPIIAINASEVLVADDGGVTIDISREASVQMNDTPDSPASASTVMVSFWQQNYIGIKAERFVTWKKGRSTAVQFISGAKYEEA